MNDNMVRSGHNGNAADDDSSVGSRFSFVEDLSVLSRFSLSDGESIEEAAVAVDIAVEDLEDDEHSSESDDDLMGETAAVEVMQVDVVEDTAAQQNNNMDVRGDDGNNNAASAIVNQVRGDNGNNNAAAAIVNRRALGARGDVVDLDMLVSGRNWYDGRRYTSGDENIDWYELLPELGIHFIRQFRLDRCPIEWLPHLRFDVLLGTLPELLGTHVLAYLDDRERNRMMWVNWNMRAIIWERVPNFWVPPVTEVQYNPRVIMGRALLDRVMEINSKITPKSVLMMRRRYRRQHDANNEGFRVGQTVEIVMENALPYKFWSICNRYKATDNVGKLAIIVRVTSCYVYVVMGSLWAEKLDVKKMSNSQVALSTGTANEIVGRRNSRGGHQRSRI